MRKIDLVREISESYRKHGWQLKWVLLRPDTQSEIRSELPAVLGDSLIEQSAIDALWFSRPSPGNCEAWEVRLLAETPYALFEKFAASDPEEKRRQVRKEMEDRLRDYLAGA